MVKLVKISKPDLYMRKISLMMLIIALIANSCTHRYEDGLDISLRSAKKRLVNKWKLDKYYYDGADSTAMFEKQFPNFIIEYRINDTYETFKNDKETISFGTYWLKSNRTVIERTENSTGNMVNHNILRLTKDELWTISDDRFEIHLKAVED
jgi:hypothetical protein